MNNTKNLQKILKEILSRKDPFGYYVVVAINSIETKNSILKRSKNAQLLIEELGNTIILRCKSRRVIEEVVKELVSKKLLAEV